MKNLFRVYIILTIGDLFTSASLTKTSEERTGLEVRCQFHAINLKFPPKLNPAYFHIGSNNRLSSIFCQVPSFGEFNIPFPFVICGTKHEIVPDGVKISNTIWRNVDEKSSKYAELTCTYDKSYVEYITSRRSPTFISERSGNGVELSVSLCRTNYHCPKMCPPSESIQDFAFFFENDIANLALVTKNQFQRLQATQRPMVAAVKELHLTCGPTIEQSQRKYFSVIDGCQAGSHRDKETILTFVDYNAVSNIVCLNVHTPPSNSCSTFYFHGHVALCYKDFAGACSDYSGMQCTQSNLQKNFVYGPLYVLSKSEGRKEITYFKVLTPTTIATSHTTTTTTTISTTTANKLASRSSQATVIDKIPSLDTGITNERENGRILLQGRAFNAGGVNAVHTQTVEAPREAGKRPKNRKDSKKHELDISDIATETTGGNRSQKTSAEISTLTPVPDLPQPLPSATMETTTVSNNSQDNTENNDENLIRIKGIVVQVQERLGTGNEENTFDIRGRSSLEGSRDSLLEKGDNDRLDDVESVEKDAKNIEPQETKSTKGEMALRHFNAGGENEAFIWAAVSSLGVFLLLSLGLLAAWGAAKRSRKARSVQE